MIEKVNVYAVFVMGGGYLSQSAQCITSLLKSRYAT